MPTPNSDQNVDTQTTSFVNTLINLLPLAYFSENNSTLPVLITMGVELLQNVAADSADFPQAW